MATRKKKTYKGDDLRKRSQDRKLGGSRYESWEGTGGGRKRAKRAKRSSARR